VTLILAILGAIALIVFGAFIGSGIHTGNPSDETPVQPAARATGRVDIRA
jgi:hypothetical protein